MSLLRFLAAGLLVLGGWHAGDSLARRLELRCRTLEQIVQLLQRLRQEIAYRRTDLRQLFCALQREADPHEELGRALLCAQLLQTLTPPECLSPEESECLAECLSGLGQTAAQAECARLDYYIQRSEELLQNAHEQRRVCAGLDRRLGLALGATLGLLVL